MPGEVPGSFPDKERCLKSVTLESAVGFFLSFPFILEGCSRGKLWSKFDI